MKYLIISAISIIGLATISIRNSADFNFIPNLKNITSSVEVSEEKKQFDDYWYKGLAEVSGYELRQSRYGEIHDGTATMIFVTEPFSKKKQVKLDDASLAGSDNLNVLKLNSTRKFLTGIYPYSMMTSVFSPISINKHDPTVKLVVSGQEWCGQVFSQMNLKGKKYHYKSFSYFETEGDQELHLNKALLEDELFSLIRMNPDLIQEGEVSIIPSGVVCRFLHEDIKPYIAMISKTEGEWNGKVVNTLNVKFAHNDRDLSIFYERGFPYRIEGWEDTYKGLTSEARLLNSKNIAYWSMHDNADRPFHEELYKK